MYMNQIHRNTAAYDKSDLTNPITQLQQYQKLLQMQLAHVGLKRHGHVRVKRQQQVAQQNCNGINKYFSKINAAASQMEVGKQSSSLELLSDSNNEQPSEELREIARELECPVCMNVAKPPIYQCEEGHIICQQCKPNLENCPSCNKKYSEPTIRCRFAEKLSDKYSTQLSKHKF